MEKTYGYLDKSKIMILQLSMETIKWDGLFFGCKQMRMGGIISIIVDK